ncbi:hypothetical protein FUA48_05270 [Flavobacterium alkalisoli]|uniref:Uncharacterized protein n=1 Tax=Flavobacterium alkalisoli TaxID=2602769 RepID=A0A5B9FS22_9FLAO|nr:hypothetical protein [Flavobacterium alkalisoli]QEE49009.1 hypothetical protein FUA48_05270 [Flavobacterium alkalisoli]
MKYFLVCFLLIISCKSGEDAGALNSVIGTASNQKSGAILYGNGEVYAIAGMQSWDTVFLNKKVKVKGHFKLMVDQDKVEIGNLGTFQAQSCPRYYLVSDATWELYDSD